MSYLNYVWVRIMFPLTNALIGSTKVHIRGRSNMVVMIRYENVPFFCFIYDRIGHSDKECPDGEVGAGVFSFGVELHASPPKRLREVKVQSSLVAACFLNFEGDQRAKLHDQASWPGSQNAQEGSSCQGKHVVIEEVVNSIPKEDERELMHGVQQMDMRGANTSSGL
jgi:hypothetical protein